MKLTKLITFIICGILLSSSAWALKAAYKTQDGIKVVNVDTPVPDGVVYPIPYELYILPRRYVTIENGVIREKTAEEKAIIDLPPKYRKVVDGVWVEKTQEEKDEADAAEVAAYETTIQNWQNNKPASLKAIENLYVDMLTNEWTTVLRDNGVIGATNVITVENTDTAQNIAYLMYIRSTDRDNYAFYSAEFDKLKAMIEQMTALYNQVVPWPYEDDSTVMSRIQKHE